MLKEQSPATKDVRQGFGGLQKLRLEQESSGHLECPGIVQLGCDIAEQRVANGCVGITKLRTVEQVERLHAQVELHVLVDGNVFIQREIPVGLARTTQRVVGTRLISVLETIEVFRRSQDDKTPSSFAFLAIR